ncbi:MAG: cupin domain-containing protein [Erysipelotrichaceae bacterium]|nr:cupin domain-containing protein [Erysipelotrichaceae bacterium]
MKYYVSISESKKEDSGNGHYSYPLLNESNGCTRDCATGISYYTALEYTPPAVHEFHEGFMVLSGKGYAKVDKEEFPLDDQISFFVPAGKEHALKSQSEDEPLVLFWFHAQA